ncbi:MAG: hypothetical protein O7E52_23060 [Candidatus Poribacteria bacterium]|nr:hypothetical protein [Candidatus Poribacteria bacterium]
MKVTRLRGRIGIAHHRAIWWAMPALLIVLPTTALPLDELQIGGYYKNFFTAFDSPVANEPIIGAVVSRLRLNLSYVLTNSLSFDLSYDFATRIQDPSLFSERPIAVAIDPLSYRVADLDSPIYPGENDPIGSFGIFQNLDRASIQFSAAFADISIGRQAIAWGSARVINSTDVVAPYIYNELDTEDRIGVDAIRVRIPVGVMGELDTGYVLGEDFDFERSAFFLRSQLNAAETDFSVLLVGFREHLMAGFDLVRAIGGAGFWFEGAYVFVNAFDDENANADNYLRTSMGMDYSFSGSTYGFIEYHFSGAGTKRPEDYLRNLTQPAYTDGAVYLMGRHYLAPGLTYQVTPLITLSGQILLNISDPSALLSPQIEYNIAPDIYLAAGGFIGIGKRPETEGEEGQFRSEFGGYPNLYFSSFRIYF